MVRRSVLGLVGLLLIVGLGAPVGASAAEGGCPNEALRVELGAGALPECRAWEMVSAPFKNGPGAGQMVAVSSDGSRVLEVSQGGYAGIAGNGLILQDYYLLSRSGSGWVSSGVDPSAALFPSQQFLGASADLGRTLWGVRTPSEPYLGEDLYVREGDGSFVKVGPLLPATGPGAGYPYVTRGSEGALPRGASRDASHVLFSLGVGNPHLPGDTTAGNGQTLFEYVGTGNARPMLVGVDGEGRQLGDCGVYAGSFESHDTYNAISGDGETVFFTVASANACVGGSGPPVNELYARLGQFPIDTVPVSEPSYYDCTRCQTGVEGFGHPAVPLANAEFQGASEDGSKVFFLTEQELFAGDTGMNLYEYDFDNPAGQKVVRVSTGSSEPGVLGVARVSEDGSHVYFGARGVLSGPNAEGVSPAPGGENLYVFERDAAYPGGRIALVAPAAGSWSRADDRSAQATPDGRFFVFQSTADLTPGDTSSKLQVFEYDALTETLVRVSVGATGYAPGQANADAHRSAIPPLFIDDASAGASGTLASIAGPVMVSADGSRVEFASLGALTAGAVEAAANGATSVYEYHSTGSIANGDVSLISSGRDTLGLRGGALAAGMTPSGDDVFFKGTVPLVVQDVDSNFVDSNLDLYDARVGGGFPAPAAGGCVGEGCHGSLSAAPSFVGAGSVSGVGGGNLAPSTPSASVGEAPKPKGKTVTRARKLAAALRFCRREPRRRRMVCEARARRRFGVSNGAGKGR